MSGFHILAPRGYYLGQVRLIGHQKWDTCTGRCKSAEAALAAAVRQMNRSHKRARSIFVDTSGYYDPHVAMEAERR